MASGRCRVSGRAFARAACLAGHGFGRVIKACCRVVSCTAGSGAVIHDAVVAAAGLGTAGAGAVPGEHLRGCPAVEFHQAPVGAHRPRRRARKRMQLTPHAGRSTARQVGRSASVPRRRRISGQMARRRLGRLGALIRSPSLRIALPRPCTELVRSSLPDLSAALRRQYLSGKPRHLLSKREDSDG